MAQQHDHPCKRGRLKLSDGLPTTTQVRQGALPNCPIAAVLAALAHTPVGQRYLDALITEYIGAVVKTTLSGDVMDKLVWKMKIRTTNPRLNSSYRSATFR